MGLFDCVGNKQTGKTWAKETRAKPRGTSPGPFVRSTSRMSRSSLFASNVSLGKAKNLDIDLWRTRVLNFLYHGEGKEDIRFLGVPYRELGFSSVTDFLVAIPAELYENYINMKPDDALVKDFKVIWQRDGIAEPGVFKWSGYVQGSEDTVFGLQLDRKKVVPYGTNDGKGLFYCKPGHRAMVPAEEVIPYRKFLRSFIGLMYKRDEPMAVETNEASSSKAKPAIPKARGHKWKQGDHVYLTKEKKWATIQWTGSIGSGDEVVDIVYDKDKPADKRVVSPDEPPISRTMSLTEFMNQVGKEDEGVARAEVQKSKDGKLVPPPPPKTKAPSEIEDEVFDDVSHENETTDDDSALDDTEDDTETDSDDDSDDSTENSEEEEPMTPPPDRPGTPPAKKMSLENIVLYDDNLQKMAVQKSPKQNRNYEKTHYRKKNEKTMPEPDEDIAQAPNEKRSKSLLSFAFNKKNKQTEPTKPDEIIKVSSLPRLPNKEKEKPKTKGRFFRKRAKSDSDGEEFSKDSSFRKARPMSESGIKVEVEQHLPPKEVSHSVNYIDNNDVVRSIASNSSYDDSDYYRPSSPGIKDTGIQMSNAMNKFKEDKSKKKKEKKDTTKSPKGSLSSFFFPKKNKFSSKEEKLDQLTATEIDIEVESPATPISPTTDNSSDFVALPNETSTVEAEATEDDPSPSSDDEEKLPEINKEEKQQKKGKSLLSSFFSKKSKSLNIEDDANEKTDDIDPQIITDNDNEQQDLIVENPYVQTSDVENKKSKKEKEKNSEESLNDDNIGRGNKIRSSFNFFSRKPKKSVPEPIEKDFPGANNSTPTDITDESVFLNSIESSENPPTIQDVNAAPVVKLRKKPSDAVKSEEERRGSSESRKSSEKEKRSSFRNSFTRRFSLPRRRKSSSQEKKDKSKSSTLEKKESLKAERPKSLFISNKAYDLEHPPLSKSNSTSVMVDIQPWYNRRSPKKNVLDTSYSTPIDSSGRSDSPTSHTALKPTKSEEDPDVPKHRMFTTPLRWSSKRAKKSAQSTDSYEHEEYPQDSQDTKTMDSDDRMINGENEVPAVTSNSTVFTSVKPILSPVSTLDIKSFLPTTVVSGQDAKQVEVPNTPSLPVEEPAPVPKSAPPVPEKGVPLQRVDVTKSSTPAPLIRLATPIGYGVKRTVPPGAEVPTPKFTATTVPNAVWTPSASLQTNPPVSAMSVLQSLPVETTPYQTPKGYMVTFYPTYSKESSNSPTSDMSDSSPSEPPKPLSPELPKSSPRKLPKSPPQLPKFPVHELSRSPSPQSRRSPPRQTRGSPPPQSRRSPPPQSRRSPPPQLKRSPPPELQSKRSPPPQSRRSPPPQLRRSPSQELQSRRSPPPQLRRSPSPELQSRRSPPPQLQKSSPPPQWRRSPPPELPKSPPPELPKSPPPVLPTSPPPVLPKSPPPVLPTSPPPVLPTSPPPVLPKSPPPVLPTSPPPLLPKTSPSFFSNTPLSVLSKSPPPPFKSTQVPSSPPPIMVTSLITQTQSPSKPIISDLPLIHTITPGESSNNERFPSPVEKSPPVSPNYYKEPSPSSPVKVSMPAVDSTPPLPSQTVPVGITTPLRKSSGEECGVPHQQSSLPRSVSVSRTPSLDKPPPLPTAPPPSRFSGPPVCVTPPTPKTSDGVSVIYATPNPPLKSALKQRKEIEFIPRGLKIYDRVLWYNGSTRVPGTVIRLYKDGTDKYTAVVKFDREGLQSPLTLTREGDAYEVTVEELVPSVGSPDANEEDRNFENQDNLSLANGGTVSNRNHVAVDKDSDDGLRKNSFKSPSVQFRHPSVEEVAAETHSVSSYSDADDGTLPPAFVEEEVNIACGIRRGIQSTEPSSCLETLLFSLFYTTNSCDIHMLFENPYDDQPSTKEIKAILRNEIVKPLRETGFVGTEAVNHLREAMEPLSTDLNSLASKAEVMMFILFQRALNLKEFITYSSDIFDYHHQILINHKDPSKCVTTQYLFENSLQLMDSFKLKTIPTPALVLEMPRTNNKMVQYEAVVPNLTLNIGHLLENGPKICLCGMVAKFECRLCMEQTRGNSSIVYCDSCRGMSDQIHHQLGHSPILSPIIQINGLMDLVAVICVNKGHYISYVKCGTERLSPWLYYDATLNEAPRVSVEQHLGMWLDRLEKYPGKYRDAFAHSLLAQLLTDNHICIYQSRNKGSYV